MDDLIERANRRMETGLPQSMEEILERQLANAPMRLKPAKPLETRNDVT